MGDGGERVLMGDGVSTTRLDGWWEGAGASWWVMGIALWGAWFIPKPAGVLGLCCIILLLYRTFVKVLKDALAHLGPYQTLTKVRYSDPYGENTVPLPAIIQI